MDSIVFYNGAGEKEKIQLITNDTNGLPASYHEYLFNPETGNYDDKVVAKGFMEYDNRENIVKRSEYETDENGTLEGIYLDTYIFDDNENLVSETGYNWDSAINDWTPWSKDDYKYDDKGNILSQIIYIYEKEKWNIWYEQYYEYNNNGKLIRDSVFHWNPNEDNVDIRRKSYKTEYSYDPNGFLLEENYFYFKSDRNGSEGHFEHESRELYKCDNDGHILEVLGYRLEDGEWMKKSKVENTYDPDGRKLSKIEYGNNTYTDEWFRIENLEYTYNKCGQQETFTIYEGWNENGWILQEKLVSYFSVRTPSGINNGETGKDFIYFENENLIINNTDVSEVKVYSMSGHLICRTAEWTISASSWNKGIYIVNITLKDGSVKTIKLLK